MKIIEKMDIKQIAKILSLAKAASSSWLLAVAGFAGASAILPLSNIITLGAPALGGFFLVKFLTEVKEFDEIIKKRLEVAHENKEIDEEEYKKAIEGLKVLSELRRDKKINKNNAE